jgi:uncharacterized protein YodC (DUF2158 family)
MIDQDSGPSMRDRPKPEFAIDDPVRLNMGGPDMLVDEIINVDGALLYRCYWVADDRGGRVATYRGDQLERVHQ